MNAQSASESEDLPEREDSVAPHDRAAQAAPIAPIDIKWSYESNAPTRIAFPCTVGAVRAKLFRHNSLQRLRHKDEQSTKYSE